MHTTTEEVGEDMTTQTTDKPRYTLEESAQRGTAIYERDIRTQVEGKHRGGIVAIDVDTGAFAVGDTVISASRLLRSQSPEAQVWLVRIGYPSVHHIGGRGGVRSPGRSRLETPTCGDWGE